MRRLAALAVLTLLTARGAEAQRLTRPTIDTVNHHIVRVMNNGPTAWTDTNGWKLVYERTVQPTEGSPGELGNPNQIHLLDDGRLVVSDMAIRSKPPAIALYDAAGKFVRPLGRPGEGPGEFRQVESGLFADTLLIQDATLGRATVMTLGGKFIRTYPTSAQQRGEVAVRSDGRLQTMKYGRGPLAYLMHFSPTGARTDSALIPEAGAPHEWEVAVTGGMSRYGIPFAGRTVRHYTRDGSTIYGMTDRYQFVVSPNGGDTALIFGRNGAPASPIPSALRDSIFRMFTSNPGVARVAALHDVPTVYPIWSGLNSDPAGNIWVTVGGNPGQAIRQLDVFAPNGHYMGAVAVPFRTATAMAWSRDRLAALDVDQNDLPRIRIFRIERRGH